MSIGLIWIWFRRTQPTSRTGLTPDIADGIEAFLAGRSDKDMRASALTRIGQNIHADMGDDFDDFGIATRAMLGLLLDFPLP